MASSLSVPSSTSPGLTPNSRSEAEIALAYNAFHQTSSAGKPQATTPTAEDLPMRPALKTRTSSNYQAAAALAHVSFEPPYPTDETAQAVRGTLSRGTTQVVLDKMATEDPGETLLSKRQSREGARRTSEVAADGGSIARPGLNTRQSYNEQDLKRMMTEKLMQDDDSKSPDAAGYESIR
ncbi:uncharacterized protein PV09_00655 [Verruconis gallopava]|uniref:Uncharacterized protein n=1 Tax=Verruconis gallopava TaxID=253628 RepID=A0A0D2BBI9_9PEZI|nr:uncharacterized protein PV09_00655 [Verruconis gallopava]KIW08709.1 hypothetical protein PV09_00655 [Verruconis gallopava]